MISFTQDKNDILRSNPSPRCLSSHFKEFIFFTSQEFEGGFLERLYVLISTWDITSWEPAAQQYFMLLIVSVEHLSDGYDACDKAFDLKP